MHLVFDQIKIDEWRQAREHSTPHRWLSCFRRGFLVIKAAVLNHLPLPQGGFFPEP